jgi:thioredoxin-related protein
MIKKSSILAIIFLNILLFSACSKENKEKKSIEITHIDKYGIPWAKDLSTAFTLAKKEKKNVIIMAVSVGCSWCKKMKERTLSNPKVAKRLEKYILVQADRETPSQREQLPPFKHVPILFFMTPKKEIIDSMRGYYQTDDFLDYLNQIEDL